MFILIIYKCYIITELMFLKVLMLMRILSGCHDVLMMPVNLKNIAFLNIYGVHYHWINSEFSKSEAV